MTDKPKFIIGIDLGTTNSAIAYFDLCINTNPRRQIQIFKIDQLTEEGVVQRLSLLPSCVYLTGNFEGKLENFLLPWQKNQTHLLSDFYFVGHLAKEKGALVPPRLIESAKSWLCTSDGFRKEKILPLEAPESEKKLSAVETLSFILKHIKESWDFNFAKNNPLNSFENQHIVLTLPASFDETARSLILEACNKAEYKELTLLEEPQAAFYSWINDNEMNFQEKLFHNDRVLVCDIGGGTTDFSLIDVEIGQNFDFKRVAVGNHLLLGGDNMDRTLTDYYEQKLIDSGHSPLNSNQWNQLKQQLKKIKEKLLTEKSMSESTIWISGRGSKIIGDGFSLTVKKEEVFNILKNGFFSIDSLEEALRKKSFSGLISNGLPYEREASFTKQLAWFLEQNGCFNKEGKYPTAILFNGGTLLPKQFQDILFAAIELWNPTKNSLRILKLTNLELAVAIGAAYFGKAKLGQGIKISSNLPRAYFLKLSDEGENVRSLCLLSKGSEEGAIYESTIPLFARPNTPVAFEILSSLTNPSNSGEVQFLRKDEISHLPPLFTILKFGKENSSDKIPVSLKICYTELGTLKLWLKSLKTDHLWNLEFQLKSASGQETILNSSQSSLGELFSEEVIINCKQYLQQAFDQKDASEAMKKLEKIIGKSRYDWSLPLIRALFDELIKLSDLRKKNRENESRWWNLAGFLLRPGKGYALDDHRISKLWKLLLSENKKLHSNDLTLQLWICYRRIAAGLNKGQQEQLFHELFTTLHSKSKILSDHYHISENLRALATFELVDCSHKIKLGEILLKNIKSHDLKESDVWVFSRLGSRKPLYGGIATMIPKNICEEWISKILSFKNVEEKTLLPVFSSFSIKHPEKYLNIDENIIQQIKSRLQSKGLINDYNQLIDEFESTSLNVSKIQWGESLPLGLEL